MKIVLAGASGAVGSALVPALREARHDVLKLVRRDARAPDEIAWEPAAGTIDVARLEGTEAFINLSGENVGAGRWSAARRERILCSRVDATRTLVTAMSKLTRRPAVFLSASAVGFYGDRGDEVLTEASGIGRGFLPEVCLAWETQANAARALGVRTVLMRFGVVLTRQGGALAKMLPIFRLGLGGRLGSGRQWMSWIALEDLIAAVLRALGDARWEGPVNFVAPGVVRNAEFTRALGRVLRRPAILPVPGWVLRAMFGRMADEALLASGRATPHRLSELGFAFRHPTLESALRAVL